MKIINTENAPGAIGPYSQGFVVGNAVYTSGQLPVDPVTGEMPADIAAQADQSCKNVIAIRHIIFIFIVQCYNPSISILKLHVPHFLSSCVKI